MLKRFDELGSSTKISLHPPTRQHGGPATSSDGENGAVGDGLSALDPLAGRWNGVKSDEAQETGSSREDGTFMANGKATRCKQPAAWLGGTSWLRGDSELGEEDHGNL